MTTLAVFLILAAVATLLLHRDLREADRRRRIREAMRPMQRAFEEFSLGIGVALVPAFSQAAKAMADMEASLRRVGRAMREAGIK